MVLLVKKVVDKRLKGQVAFTASMWQDDSTILAGAYKRIIKNTEILKGVVPKDESVIYNIQCLKAMLAKAEDEAICIGLVYRAQKNKEVYFCTPDMDGPEMSLEMVEQVLNKPGLEKWTLETLKDIIPEECKSAVNCKEICPGIEAKYQDTIKAFEV